MNHEIILILQLVISVFLALMLAVQSYVLVKLLPEIKKISANSSVFSIFKSKPKDQ